MRFVKPRVAVAWCLFLAMPVLWSSVAGAHEVRPMIATIELMEQGAVTLNISLDLEAAIAGVGGKRENTSHDPAATQYDRLRSLPAAMLRAEFYRFAPYFLDLITLEADEKRLPLRIATVEIPEIGDPSLPRMSQLSLEGLARPGIQRLYWRIDPRLGDSVIRLRDSASGQVRDAEFVAAGNNSGPLSVEGFQRQSWLSVFANYLEVGFTHIIPHGLDHMLFVIGLFLLSTRPRALLWQVNAFTVAHTLTLALGMVGIIKLSAAVVEPLIAASIIYVAVENIVTDRLHPWRPVVVFCFGLLHGLGFAGVLQEIGPAPSQFMLSLFAFNLGVELGQLAVIAVCFLTAGWTLEQKWYRRGVVLPASMAIAVVAAIWFGERIGLA